jgi:hypothetical protein
MCWTDDTKQDEVNPLNSPIHVNKTQ